MPDPRHPGRGTLERFSSGVVQDFRARSWAYLGHARRLGSDLRGAEEAIALAEHFFEEGSADALEEARVLDLKPRVVFAWTRAKRIFKNIKNLRDAPLPGGRGP